MGGQGEDADLLEDSWVLVLWGQGHTDGLWDPTQLQSPRQ